MRVHLYLPPPPHPRLPSVFDRTKLSLAQRGRQTRVAGSKQWGIECESLEMRNGIKRFRGDSLAFIRVISVSVQEFKNVFRKSLCFRFSAKVQLTSWLESSDGTEANFNYSIQSRNWDVDAADILLLSDENAVSQKSRWFTRSGKITSCSYWQAFIPDEPYPVKHTAHKHPLLYAHW